MGSRLTNISPLSKNFMTFKGNMQKSDISRKIKFGQIHNFEALIYKSIFLGNFLEGTRKARKSLRKFVNKDIVLSSSFYIDVSVTFRTCRQQRDIVVKTASCKIATSDK